jgi:hypothetical protein
MKRVQPRAAPKLIGGGLITSDAREVPPDGETMIVHRQGKDTVPVILQRGELVVNKSNVPRVLDLIQKYDVSIPGLEMQRQIHGDEMLQMAKGGLVRKKKAPKKKGARMSQKVVQIVKINIGDDKEKKKDEKEKTLKKERGGMGRGSRSSGGRRGRRAGGSSFMDYKPPPAPPLVVMKQEEKKSEPVPPTAPIPALHAPITPAAIAPPIAPLAIEPPQSTTIIPSPSLLAYEQLAEWDMEEEPKAAPEAAGPLGFSSGFSTPVLAGFNAPIMNTRFLEPESLTIVAPDLHSIDAGQTMPPSGASTPLESRGIVKEEILRHKLQEERQREFEIERMKREPWRYFQKFAERYGLEGQSFNKIKDLASTKEKRQALIDKYGLDDTIEYPVPHQLRPKPLNPVKEED